MRRPALPPQKVGYATPCYFTCEERGAVIPLARISLIVSLKVRASASAFDFIASPPAFIFPSADPFPCSGDLYTVSGVVAPSDTKKTPGRIALPGR